MSTLNTPTHSSHSSSGKNSILHTLAWLWPYWKPMPYRLAFLVIATPLMVGFSVWTPQFIKTLFDAMQAQTLTRELLIHNVGLLLGVGLLHFALHSVIQNLRGWTNCYFEHSFRVRLSRVMLKLGLGFFQRFRTGDITTRLIDDISEKKLGWFACSGIFRLYEALLIITGCLVCMLQLHIGLTLLTALPMAGVALFYIRSSRRTQGYSQQSQQAISDLNAYLTSTLDGIRVVKAYGQEQRASEAFSAVVENQYAKDMALARVKSLLELSYSRFAEIGILAVFLAGGWLVIHNQLKLGSLIAFNNYIFMLIWPLVDIGQFFMKGRQAGVSVERVRELEDYPPEIAQAAQPLPWPRESLKLSFDKVGFTYADQRVLTDVSFTAQAGQKVALAGAIGSGKSLLLDLIPRMLEPDQGQIVLNEQPLEAYSLESLRGNIGFVSQTPSLFSASIRENILFGREGISDADLAAAIRVAQLEQDLPLFSDGLETLIGQRGVKISGGQKQRIAIARALVHKPQLLILDDCTSALDAETEARFWEALQAFVPDMLVLLVTHRVATLQQADQIVLLKNGRVAALGNHDALSTDPVYQQLYLHESADSLD